MGAMRTVRALRSLAVILVLQATTMTYLAFAEDKSLDPVAPAAVRVLCTPDLPGSVPSCEEFAAALDQEIEEYGMHAEPASWPESGATGAPGVPGTVLLPAGVQFTVWEWAEGTRLVIHVMDYANDVEVSKSLDLASLAEIPQAVDLAILARTLMGASLYTSLASLPEDGALADLAVPPDKKAMILALSTPSAPQPPPSPAAPRWAPQFVLGWGLVSYPGQHNAMTSSADTYNGIALALRFPFLEQRMWMGFSATVTQSIQGSAFHAMDDAFRERYVDDVLQIRGAVSTDDQVLMALDLAWVPLYRGRFNLWISAGPGLTRVSWKLLTYYHDTASASEGLSVSISSLELIRVTLGGGFGLSVEIVDRVRIEAGLRVTWCSTLGAERPRVLLPSENDYVYTVSAPLSTGKAGFTFWLAMVFG